MIPNFISCTWEKLGVEPFPKDMGVAMQELCHALGYGSSTCELVYQLSNAAQNLVLLRDIVVNPYYRFLFTR